MYIVLVVCTPEGQYLLSNVVTVGPSLGGVLIGFWRIDSLYACLDSFLT